ncbi:MAG: AtpZ/AtpI family protein [Paracoccaceae bacterium]|nr:F0F1 ATP synthase subunit I [Marinovum sp.]MDA9159816.1 AtpZ/AtpI family protein [Paracoccaceae bacterium]MBP06839.1 F0F1 ATP synthase subunit I [Marinovum sp.]MBT4233333.1 AtpZ/AtpI family protein [Marinovum sp.]MBT6525664.1 AtpZ/AtpI family protein [Marinovum sp.]
MTDPDEKQRMAQLEDKIANAKAVHRPQSQIEDHHSQAHAGWRMVTELVAGLLIGFCIGYGLDSLFGTLPIFLVLFVLLGFAAGVKTMLRSAQDIQRAQSGQTDKDEGT